MIGTRKTGSKADMLAEDVFQPLWDAREKLRPLPGDTLTGFHMSLCLFYGLASFLAGQTVADVKPHGALASAPDWWTFCCSGPGSRRGLNNVLGRSTNASWNEDEFRMRILDLKAALDPRVAALGWPEMDAQNTQNQCCEWSKYVKALNGEGRPKQLFRPKS